MFETLNKETLSGRWVSIFFCFVLTEFICWDGQPCIGEMVTNDCKRLATTGPTEQIQNDIRYSPSVSVSLPSQMLANMNHI